MPSLLILNIALVLVTLHVSNCRSRRGDIICNSSRTTHHQRLHATFILSLTINNSLCPSEIKSPFPPYSKSSSSLSHYIKGIPLKLPGAVFVPTPSQLVHGTRNPPHPRASNIC